MTTAHLQGIINTSEVATGKNNKIIACPNCEQKLRIKIPLPSNVGRCIKCLSRFRLIIDEKDSLYITLIRTSAEQNDYSMNDLNTVEDCLVVLGLPTGASKSDIRSAYRKRIMEYHPDKTTKLGEKLQKIAEEESKQINVAYSMLKEKGYV